MEKNDKFFDPSKTFYFKNYRNNRRLIDVVNPMWLNFLRDDNFVVQPKKSIDSHPIKSLRPRSRSGLWSTKGKLRMTFPETSQPIPTSKTKGLVEWVVQLIFFGQVEGQLAQFSGRYAKQPLLHGQDVFNQLRFLFFRKNAGELPDRFYLAFPLQMPLQSRPRYLVSLGSTADGNSALYVHEGRLQAGLRPTVPVRLFLVKPNHTEAAI